VISAFAQLSLLLAATVVVADVSLLGDQRLPSDGKPSVEVLDHSRPCPQAIHRLDSAIAAIGAARPTVRYNTLPSTVKHPSLPANSVLVVILGMGSAPSTAAATNRRSVDLMHSPQLQRRLASMVFQSCAEIVKVSFTLVNTDWSMSFFRGNRSVAMPARCLDPGPHTGEPGWGEEICL
jgi:hypothetical protein